MPQQFMTRQQRDDELEAVDLLALPLQNVTEIASKLLQIIGWAILHPQECSLMSTPQVVTGLSTLQSAVAELSRAYITHTNTVLGKGPGVSFDQLNTFPNQLGGDGFFSARGPTPAPMPEPTESKKRKRAPHDKNAPKRALTPFFLYLQSERQNIGNELGDNHTAKEVQDEGGKRWREMSESEKAVGPPVGCRPESY